MFYYMLYKAGSELGISYIDRYEEVWPAFSAFGVLLKKQTRSAALPITIHISSQLIKSLFIILSIQPSEPDLGFYHRRPEPG